MKQKLFLDFDSTLVDSVDAFIKVYIDRYKNTEGFVYPNVDTLRQWDFRDICPLLKRGEVQDIFSNKEFFQYLKPFRNTVEVLNKYKDKYEMCIVTIGTLKNLSHKAEYIEKYFPMVHNTILINNTGCKMDKSMIKMKGTDECPSVFIDDHGDNLKSSNADIKIVYGKAYDWNKDIVKLRAYNWLEVDRLLDYYLVGG